MTHSSEKGPHEQDIFELFLDRHPDLPSVALIRSMELKHIPRQFLREPVLDLCCGDGFFTQVLGIENVCGCDIDQHAVARAAKLARTYRGVWNCDARHLAVFSDAQFNTVFSNCALEHVNGIDQALDSVARVLKPGGHLVMSVPDINLNNWFFPKVLFSALGFADYGQRLCDEYNRKQNHFNICSFETWKGKLEASGLVVQKSFYLFSKSEYQVVTFFESFAIDSFPSNFWKMLYSLIREKASLSLRKKLWRKLLKPIYLKSEQRAEGGELFIVAKKESGTTGKPSG